MHFSSVCSLSLSTQSSTSILLVIVSLYLIAPTECAPQLAKFDRCANQTYQCIESSKPNNEQQLYCCCQEIWFSCRRALACGEPNSSVQKKSKSNVDLSCQYLLKQDRLFAKKQGKVKQCATVHQKCPNGAMAPVTNWTSLGAIVVAAALTICTLFNSF